MRLMRMILYHISADFGNVYFLAFKTLYILRNIHCYIDLIGKKTIFTFLMKPG